MGPVATVELFFAEVGDGEHADPGGGVGCSGEDHAVVEEDCVYWSHGSNFIVSEIGLGLSEERLNTDETRIARIRLICGV